MPVQGSCGLCCGLFWKTAPPLTIAIPAVILIGGIAFFITCMAMFVQFQCFIMEYSALMPGAIFLKGQVWRLITPHLVSANLWQVFFVIMSFVPPAFVLEKKIGSLRFAGLMLFCGVFTSLFTSLVAALLYYIPGINRWSYFKGQWLSISDLGPTSLVLFVLICSTRAFRQRTLPFCFCQIPSWAYIIMVYIFSQLMMYPPWYGVFYNLGAIVAAFIIPGKWLQGTESANDMFGRFMVPANEATVDQKNIEMRSPGPDGANENIKESVQIQAGLRNEERFTAHGRIL